MKIKNQNFLKIVMKVKRLFSSSLDKLLFHDESKTISCSTNFVRSWLRTYFMSYKHTEVH